MRSVAMGVISCMLLALGHIYFANAILLERPIALGVLHTDLHTLETTFSSPKLWIESKLIKYDDALKFVVDGHTVKDAVSTFFLRVGGKLTVAELNEGSQHTLQNLFYRNGYFYFDQPTSEPVPQPDNYFIIEYEPLIGYSGKKPDIEYVTENEIMSTLNDVIPSVRYESKLTQANIVKTYFRIGNGFKVNVWYDKASGVAVFKARFNVLITTDKRDLIKTNVPIYTLSFYLDDPSTFGLSALGTVHSVSIFSPPQLTTASTGGTLKLRRKQVIQDMLQGSPTYPESSSKIVGAAAYDKYKVATLSYSETNHKTMLRLAGRFRTSDGIPFHWLCLATPDGTPDRKNADSYRSSKVLSEEPVLFPCKGENTDIALIVLKEDDDFIEMMDGALRELDLMTPGTQIGPLLEYISYEKFLKTLQIVSDVMKMKCSRENRYSHRSYKLFVDVFLIYDCKTRLVRFDDLNLWVGFDEHASSLWENVSSVAFNSNTNQFQHVVETINNFKVRQLGSVISKRFPIDLLYEAKCEVASISVGIDLESVEWDLYNIYKNLNDRPLNILPATGIVYVDDMQLLVAHMSEDTIGGVKKRIVVSKGKGLFNTTQGYCQEEREIIYDGSKMYTRTRSSPELREVKANAFLPIRPCLSSLRKKALAKFYFYKQSYVKTSSFLNNVRELAWLIRKECVKRKNNGEHKFYFYMYFFKDEEPVTGYYECTLQYMFFPSDFKVVKHPTTKSKTPLQRSIKALNIESGTSPVSSTLLTEYEAKINGSNSGVLSEEIEVRRKYSNFILQDLIYDHTGHKLHSRSMNIQTVCALRPLPSVNGEENNKKNDRTLDVVILASGCKVKVYG